MTKRNANELSSSELSPGNHIIYRNRVIKVDPSEILGLSINTPESTFYKRLPLSTEVLEMFDFKIEGGKFMHPSGFSLIPKYKENGIDIDGYVFSSFPSATFRYAHDLENFFRIVTGQALNYQKHGKTE